MAEDAAAVDTKSLLERALELFDTKAIGDVVTYEELKAAGLDIQRYRPTVLKAIRRHLRTRKLACACVKNVGYQVTHPEEAPRLISRRIGNANRQLVRGHEISEHVDRDLMSQETRQRVDLLEVSLQAIRKEVRGIEAKVERHARRLDVHQRAIQGLQEGVAGRFGPEEVSVLEQMIERHRREAER